MARFVYAVLISDVPQFSHVLISSPLNYQSAFIYEKQGRFGASASIFATSASASITTNAG